MRRANRLGLTVAVTLATALCGTTTAGAVSSAPGTAVTPAGEGDAYPTLDRAELFTLTGDDDNKDHDTGIYVTVKSYDGKSMLASVNGADSSGKDATTYNDDSHHIVPLTVEGAGTSKYDARGFKVRLSIKTNGNDEWDIDEARVTLYFRDGTTLVADKYDFTLDGDEAAADFQAPM